MADRIHKDLSTRKSLLTLVNTAGYSISQAALVSASLYQQLTGGYNYLGKELNTVVQVLDEGVYPLLSRMQFWLQKQSGTHSSLLLLLELFLSSLDLLETALRRLKDEQLFARIAAKKELLKDDHKLFRLAFAEENIIATGIELYSQMR
ncbi:hypothetical protein C0J52_15378 [Blattella germanica]|nr:hypothetical protein C0J52_15378 [Blattella germanica]